MACSSIQPASLKPVTTLLLCKRPVQHARYNLILDTSHTFSPSVSRYASISTQISAIQATTRTHTYPRTHTAILYATTRIKPDKTAPLSGGSGVAIPTMQARFQDAGQPAPPNAHLRDAARPERLPYRRLARSSRDDDSGLRESGMTSPRGGGVS